MAALATLVPADSNTVEPGVVPNGTGFRAVVRYNGQIVWMCNHVHFTDHSARACASRASVSVTPLPIAV